MIRNSFIFLPGIDHVRERKIREQGITDWDSFLENPVSGISKRKKAFYDKLLREAKRQLYYGNSSFFSRILPSPETWRLYKFFKEDAIFLDIEISCTGKKGYLTVIGLFDGIQTKTMIRGRNLNIDLLDKELRRYKLLLTFNGSSFDLPFLNKRYPGLIPDIPHIDIKHCCSRIGLNGGLKVIEKKLGIEREPLVEKLYGGDPLRLWKRYIATGDDYYLRLLAEYNEQDVISLKKIAEYTVEKLTFLSI